MNYVKKTLPILISLNLIACTTIQDNWVAHRYDDDFLDKKICRVEKESATQSKFSTGLFYQFYNLNFYVENYGGETRVGIRSQPPVPIINDVQLKTNNKLYTFTNKDVPIDVKNSSDALSTNIMSTLLADNKKSNTYNESIHNIIQESTNIRSPYRAFSGENANLLLKDILTSQGSIKFRSIGFNAAQSTTGEFEVDQNFRNSIMECGINLK
jgi:hypothetical protein